MCNTRCPAYLTARAGYTFPVQACCRPTTLSCQAGNIKTLSRIKLRNKRSMSSVRRSGSSAEAWTQHVSQPQADGLRSMGPYGIDTYAPRSGARSDSDRPLPSLPFRLRTMTHPSGSGWGTELLYIDFRHRGYGLCEKLSCSAARCCECLHLLLSVGQFGCSSFRASLGSFRPDSLAESNGIRDTKLARLLVGRTAVSDEMLRSMAIC